MAYTGSCLCGGVSFQIDGELAPIQVCHCQQCRKAHGQLLQSYESSPGKLRVFCGRCGSPVFSRRPALPDVLRLRAGLINEPLEVGLAWHAHTGSKSNWWHIEDGAPQYKDGHAPQA